FGALPLTLTKIVPIYFQAAWIETLTGQLPGEGVESRVHLFLYDVVGNVKAIPINQLFHECRAQLRVRTVFAFVLELLTDISAKFFDSLELLADSLSEFVVGCRNFLEANRGHFGLVADASACVVLRLVVARVLDRKLPLIARTRAGQRLRKLLEHALATQFNLSVLLVDWLFLFRSRGSFFGAYIGGVRKGFDLSAQ